jgi:hypothetical protein
MRRCGIIGVHRISSKSLKRLRITDRSSFAHDYRVRISAPSLASLQLDNFLGAVPLLECMPLLEKAFVGLYDYNDYCQPRLQAGVNQGCESCYCYPTIGHYQGVLLNSLSNATHLELIAGPQVVLVH